MSLSYPKVVRGLYLLLLTVSSVISFTKYHTNAVAIAVLSLVGFIAFDVMCYLRDKNPPMKDLAPELAKLKEAQDKLNTDVNDIKNDHSIAALASTFRRK